MHLEAMRAQIVWLDGLAAQVRAGERIHTENSYKYAPAEFDALLERRGFRAPALLAGRGRRLRGVLRGLTLPGQRRRRARGAGPRTASARRAERNCGRSRGCASRGVAHEPPRSTYWPHMNLPLYSPTAPAAAGSPGRARSRCASTPRRRRRAAPARRRAVARAARADAARRFRGSCRRPARRARRLPTRLRSAAARPPSARRRRPRRSSRGRPACSGRPAPCRAA